MSARDVQCPLCGRPATLTLYEDHDGMRGTEGHRIEFACPVASHVLSEVGMLRLWAADRFRAASERDLAHEEQLDGVDPSG